MKSSRAKEIKEKLFVKMYGTGHTDGDKKKMMADELFKRAYRLTKEKYNAAPTVRR